MRILALTSALALGACSNISLPTPSAGPLPAATDFNPIAAAPGLFANPLEAAQHYAQYDPEPGEGPQSMDLVSRAATQAGLYEMVFSVEQYADDSLKAKQWRIVVTKEPGGWRVTTAGERYKCYRGVNTVLWQKALCP